MLRKLNDNLALDRDTQTLIARVTDPRGQNTAWNAGLGNCTLTADRQDTIWALPWNEESCRLLSNVGVDTRLAAPFLYSPNFPLVEGAYPAMMHQKLTAAFMTINPRAYVLSTCRTGKTAAAILAMDYMQRNGLVTGGFLIITTMSTIHSVWQRSIETTLPGAHISVCNRSTRETGLKEPADFYITNYDSVRLSRDAFLRAIRDGRIGGCVIDELTHVGNVSAQRTKAILALANELPYVYGMTGTPTANSDMVFGMCKVVNETRLPCTTKGAWQNLTTFKYGPEPFMRKMSADAPNIIHRAMQPAIRFNKDDLLDLPPITTQTRHCALSAEQAKARDELKRECMTLLESGEVITAANGGVLFAKLMQVPQGFVNNKEGEPTILEHKSRLDTILDVIAETDRKVVIFGTYRTSNLMLQEELTKAGYKAGRIDGSVGAAERAKILEAFDNDPKLRVLVLNTTAAAFGLELAAADTMVFNGPPMLGGFVYAQALERLSSAKQTAKNINIVHIVGSPEEARGFQQLAAGKQMGDAINSLFEELKREKTF